MEIKNYDKQSYSLQPRNNQFDLKRGQYNAILAENNQLKSQRIELVFTKTDAKLS